MKYIDQSLTKDEIIIYETKLHWKYLVPSALLLLITVILFFWYDGKSFFHLFNLNENESIFDVLKKEQYGGSVNPNACPLFFLLVFSIFKQLTSLVNYNTSEFGITN